jgi:Glutathione S-transferase, N-terminal domain
MAEITVFGFPHSSFVHIARLVLTHKEMPYTFHDLEPDMGSPKHLALHPFDRVPILQHDDFVLYETSAIVAYLEEMFPKPSLQPHTMQFAASLRKRIIDGGILSEARLDACLSDVAAIADDPGAVMTTFIVTQVAGQKAG